MFCLTSDSPKSTRPLFLQITGNLRGGCNVTNTPSRSGGCETLRPSTTRENVLLKSIFSYLDEYERFLLRRVCWLADCLTPAASWLPLHSLAFSLFFYFFFKQYAIHYSALLGAVLRTVWEKRLFFRTSVSSVIPIGGVRVETVWIVRLCGPKPTACFSQERKKREWMRMTF